MTDASTSLDPRKSPVQDRSRATVDAIAAATIQVLTAEGLARCTTTRVAERAGVSVGSLYQYYPNRGALLAAALQRHIDRIAGAVERACADLSGASIDAMADGLSGAFLAAKLEDPAESRALYAVAADHGGGVIVAKAQARMRRAVSAMLATAADARFSDVEAVALTTLAALAGTTRTLLDGGAPKGFAEGIGVQARRLVAGYLTAAAE